RSGTGGEWIRRAASAYGPLVALDDARPRGYSDVRRENALAGDVGVGIARPERVNVPGINSQTLTVAVARCRNVCDIGGYGLDQARLVGDGIEGSVLRVQECLVRAERNAAVDAGRQEIGDAQVGGVVASVVPAGHKRAGDGVHGQVRLKLGADSL